MEKIFDKDVYGYLREVNVSDSEINKIRFETLKTKSVERLKLFTQALENDDYDAVRKFIEYSPSGDGYGCENYFINFGDIIGEGSLDISELFSYLVELKSNIK